MQSDVRSSSFRLPRLGVASASRAVWQHLTSCVIFRCEARAAGARAIMELSRESKALQLLTNIHQSSRDQTKKLTCTFDAYEKLVYTFLGLWRGETTGKMLTLQAPSLFEPHER